MFFHDRNPREVKAHGWRITARCALGKQAGMHRFRESVYCYELDLESLIWMRGAAFQVSLGRAYEKPAVRVAEVALLFRRAGARRGEAGVKAFISFMDYDLGYFDHETCRLEPIENPFGPKVLPMSPV